MKLGCAHSRSWLLPQRLSHGRFAPLCAHPHRSSGCSLGSSSPLLFIGQTNNRRKWDAITISRFAAASSSFYSSFSEASREDPLQRYERLIAEGVIKDDPAQRKALAPLQELYQQTLLQKATPEPTPPPSVSSPSSSSSSSSWFSWLRNPLSSSSSSPTASTAEPPAEAPSSSSPLGVYLYGDVGCGKTFLMDLFYDCIPASRRKRRVHFHAFMLDIHGRIHHWRQHKKQQQQSSNSNNFNLFQKGEEVNEGEEEGDPLPALARGIAAQTGVLCFDEFQVTDVADAMILHRLFSLLFRNDVLFVATSNRAPDELYQGGLQRDRFLPFIDLLYRRCRVHRIVSGNDYRLTGKASQGVYFLIHPRSPSSSFEQHHQQQHLKSESGGSEAEQRMERAFAELTHHQQAHTMQLSVAGGGRKLRVPKTARGVAWFSFNDLCKQNLGAADYIALSEAFHTVLLSGIPKMNRQSVTEARRFITLIDELYNHKVKLLCSAYAEPAHLFEGGDEKDLEGREVFDDATGRHMGTIWHGKEEQFAFQRAVSRLIEMQSEEYLKIPHKGHSSSTSNY
ncbi:Lactation elevated protein 1 [Balamuthia mandrillaris]